MLDVFYTEDGIYHQASLFREDKEIVNLSVDRLTTLEKQPAEWEWMIWGTQGAWREPKMAWYGAEPSLEMAKSAALEAAIALADGLSNTARPLVQVYESSLAA
jgi:hypothetical protein